MKLITIEYTFNIIKFNIVKLNLILLILNLKNSRVTCKIYSKLDFKCTGK